MANRTASLYLRITTADGKRRYCKSVYQSKGRLKPQYAMVDGEPEHHKEGVYYLRFGADDGKQHFVLIGKDPYVALDTVEKPKKAVIAIVYPPVAASEPFRSATNATKNHRSLLISLAPTASPFTTTNPHLCCELLQRQGLAQQARPSFLGA
jgi:hypothetical protein